MKIQSSNYIKFLILLIFLGSLNSCSLLKGRKNFENTDRKTAKMVTKLIENQVNVDWIKTKVKATANMNGQKLSFPVEIRLQKDELIWGVAKKFGFEVGRVLMDRDSVYILNRIARSYDQFSWAQIADMAGDIPVNFELVQQALLGNPVFFSNEFTLDETKEDIWINSQNSSKIGSYKISSDGLLSAMELSDKNSKGRVYITMDDYQKIDDKQRFAFFRTFEVYDNSQSEGSLKLDFNKIETEGPLEFPFEIPKKYKKGLLPN
jgi:hypothetical protein